MLTAMEKLKIYNADPTTCAFIKQWYGNSDFISAHTSGSTGTPKLIKLSKPDMKVSAAATCKFFNINSSSHLVMPLSADYIAGKMMIVRAIVSGASLTVIPPSRNLKDLQSVTIPIDLLPIVPSQIEGLLNSEARDRVRNVIVGGASLTQEQEVWLKDRPFKAYATYGMTETCSHVALRRIGQENYFTAMPGISFKKDEDSCLVIDAPLYSQRVYATNDIVELLDDVHFRWLGRRDNVINSGGIKIIPEMTEPLLAQYLPAGLNFYLTSQASDIWGEELVMVVEGCSPSQLDWTSALANLPHHLIPKKVIGVDKIARTSNGKIRRLNETSLKALS